MYRPKNCKKCGGKMQQGGQTMTRRPQTIDEANAYAKDIAIRMGLISGVDTHVGNTLPIYRDPQGNILPDVPMPITKSSANPYIPSEVTELQLSSETGQPYYLDPKTGDMVYTTQDNFFLPRFQKNRSISQQQQAVNRVSTPMAANLPIKMKGGRLTKMQQGGMPRQQDFPDYESWVSAMDAWMQANQPQQLARSNDLSSLMGNFNDPLQNITYPAPEVDPQQAPLNRVQEGIQAGIIEAPKDFNGTAQQWYDSTDWMRQKKPLNLQDIAIRMRGVRTGLGWLSGAVERGRQNQYDMMQQTALGQMNPMQVSDFQPNPYNLYMKHGGNLKTILQDFNKWSNNAKPMDMTQGNGGNPEMKKGGYEIDRMIIVRKLLPELLKLGRLGTAKYRNYKKGGIHIKPENKGKFTDYCGGTVTDECIKRALSSKSKTLRKRANFARNARKWNK